MTLDGRASRRRDRALRGRRRRLRRRRSARDYREFDERPARGDHRAPLARGHRPAGGGAGRGGRGRARRTGSPRGWRHELGRRRGDGPGGGRDATPLQREQARTIFEKGAPGRRAFTAPALDVPEADAVELLPPAFRRSGPARLPEVSEPELVRHYVRLSKRNFDLDSGFYPLGSCTMKHNPRLHERVAALPGPRPAASAPAPGARAGRARAHVAPGARARRGRRACRTCRCSRARAPTASSPASC